MVYTNPITNETKTIQNNISDMKYNMKRTKARTNNQKVAG